ncbi:MAG: hypothetical protein NTV19_07750 [Burkholderiales bacterium]|nr:hypothetical protein [Burkholderiales bacterium]
MSDPTSDPASAPKNAPTGDPTSVPTGDPTSAAEPPVVLPEHRFAEPVSGPAYTPWARMTTITSVAGLMLYGFNVLSRHADIAWPILMLMATGGAVLLTSTWYILTGKTTIDARGIRQDWFTPKDYSWHEISRVRFVRMPMVSAGGDDSARPLQGGARRQQGAARCVSRHRCALPGLTTPCRATRCCPTRCA